MSANTGLAPQCVITLTEAMKVSDGTITSSPVPNPSALRTKKPPAVQDDTPRACPTPHRAAKRFSNSARRGPPTTQPLPITLDTAASSSLPKNGRLNAMAFIPISLGVGEEEPSSRFRPPKGWINRNSGIETSGYSAARPQQIRFPHGTRASRLRAAYQPQAT